MKFDLKFKELRKLENFEYEIYEKDFIMEILNVIEEVIYETGNIDFYFEALGEAWNVTIFGDLSVFLEQLEDVYKVVKGITDKYILDFYEVGTDRKLLLTKLNNQIKIENHNENTWKSSVNESFVDANVLENDIINFIQKVKEIIIVNSPSLYELETLREWFNNFKSL